MKFSNKIKLVFLLLPFLASALPNKERVPIERNLSSLVIKAGANSGESKNDTELFSNSKLGIHFSKNINVNPPDPEKCPLPKRLKDDLPYIQSNSSNRAIFNTLRSEYPKWVKGYSLLGRYTDAASVSIRRNPRNIQIVNEYFREYPDRALQIRSGIESSANKQRYVDDLLAPAPYGDRDVRHRVRGHYSEIDKNDDLQGILQDEPGFIPTEIVTFVDSPTGHRGQFIRSYSPTTKQFTMDVAFRNDAPKLLQGRGTPLIQGEGTPTQMYVTLRQMKLLGIPDGEIKTLKMSNIQNKETALWLASTMESNGYTNLSQIGDLILSSPHNVAGYATSTMKQASYRATSGQLINSRSTQQLTIQDLLDDGTIKLSDLSNYPNLTNQSPTFIGFNIIMQLNTF